MCGSLLSKLKNPRNKVDPAVIIFSEPTRVRSQAKLANEDSACYEGRGFWEDGDRNGESSMEPLAAPRKPSVKDGGPSETDCLSLQNMEVAANALDCVKPVLLAINSKNVPLPLVERNSGHLLESAREILTFQAQGVSSSSNTVTAQPFSSVNSTLSKMKTAVAFEIPVSDEKTVCPSARIPCRLRRRGKVTPELTLEDVKERIRAAEERKLKELERIRESARSRAGMSRPHPAEVSAQATKEKIAAKQAAAERKRNDEMEYRKQAGNRTSQKIRRIAEARAFAKTQLESSIEQKLEKTEQRKIKSQQKSDRKKKQKQLREDYAKKVKDRVRIVVLGQFLKITYLSNKL